MLQVFSSTTGEAYHSEPSSRVCFPSAVFGLLGDLSYETLYRAMGGHEKRGLGSGMARKARLCSWLCRNRHWERPRIKVERKNHPLAGSFPRLLKPSFVYNDRDCFLELSVPIGFEWTRIFEGAALSLAANPVVSSHSVGLDESRSGLSARETICTETQLSFRRARSSKCCARPTIKQSPSASTRPPRFLLGLPPRPRSCGPLSLSAAA